MKNYVFLYFVSARIEPSDEQMAAWNKWFESLGDKLVDGGNPFNGKAEAEIKNGQVSMEADQVSGYSIIKAGSLEEAVTIAKGCPMAMAGNEAWVRVYETMPM